MKIGLLFLYSVLNICAIAQESGAPQKATTETGQRRAARPANNSYQQRFDSLRSVGEYSRNAGTWSRTSAFGELARIYRKPTEKESDLLSPGKDDLKKFASFLRQTDTGLTKLMIDRGCADSPNILNISERCVKYPMPGAGSSFSFREKNYCIHRLSDLTYDDEGFHSFGSLSHAIMANVGDVPLENISMNSNGLKFLNGFETVNSFEQARRTDKKITDGIESDGFFYGRSAETKENSTYVLRVVAYRGNIYRANNGFVYDELDFDERRDVTIAFRVVNRDAESVTILWKILSNQKSPLLKKPSREELKAAEKFTAETEKAGGN